MNRASLTAVTFVSEWKCSNFPSFGYGLEEIRFCLLASTVFPAECLSV